MTALQRAAGSAPKIPYISGKTGLPEASHARRYQGEAISSVTRPSSAACRSARHRPPLVHACHATAGTANGRTTSARCLMAAATPSESAATGNQVSSSLHLPSA